MKRKTSLDLRARRAAARILPDSCKHLDEETGRNVRARMLIADGYKLGYRAAKREARDDNK